MGHLYCSHAPKVVGSIPAWVPDFFNIKLSEGIRQYTRWFSTVSNLIIGMWIGAPSPSPHSATHTVSVCCFIHAKNRVLQDSSVWPTTARSPVTVEWVSTITAADGATGSKCASVLTTSIVGETLVDWYWFYEGVVNSLIILLKMKCLCLPFWMSIVIVYGDLLKIIIIL